MKRALPDPDVLHRLFRYDEATGELSWRNRMSQRVKAGGRAGCLTVHGYIDVKIDGFTHKAHRVIWKMLHGTDPANEIDHVDGNRANNRQANLRDATPAQNRQNSVGKGEYSKGTHRLGNRWIAQIQVDGVKRHLGSFLTEGEAHEAYTAAAMREFGAFARAA